MLILLIYILFQLWNILPSLVFLCPPPIFKYTSQCQFPLTTYVSTLGSLFFTSAECCEWAGWLWGEKLGYNWGQQCWCRPVEVDIFNSPPPPLPKSHCYCTILIIEWLVLGERSKSILSVSPENVIPDL